MRPHHFTKFTPDFAQRHVFSRQHATIPYFVSHNLNCEPSLHYFPCSNSRDCLAMYPLCWSVSVSFFGLFCRLLYYCSSPYALVFLVGCYATLQPALSVGPSVRPSVGPSHFTFLGFLWFPAQMIKRPQIWPLPTRTRLR